MTPTIGNSLSMFKGYLWPRERVGGMTVHCPGRQKHTSSMVNLFISFSIVINFSPSHNFIHMHIMNNIYISSQLQITMSVYLGLYFFQVIFVTDFNCIGHETLENLCERGRVCACMCVCRPMYVLLLSGFIIVQIVAFDVAFLQ